MAMSDWKCEPDRALHVFDCVHELDLGHVNPEGVCDPEPLHEFDDDEGAAAIEHQTSELVAHAVCREGDLSQLEGSDSQCTALRDQRALRDGDATRCVEGGVRVKEEGEAPVISGPKYFVPDVVYAPSDVDPQEVLCIPDGSEPSQECLEPVQSQAHVFSTSSCELECRWRERQKGQVACLERVGL